ncbi:hydantoinase/oxoprolinase family protein [Aestuariicoccus sp. MJ-SS9]|uniref:hydantoinase/oxoprolinase family protein n=1 Tax=Aestuariicoccus sp. MJ-SS9 TaxID=3079855 RepID=UPI0029128D20|nr:hydantoinase/oxoprolinase family protein [Aestuariicoccus sp. MJ-SS9]MDU8912544.1 hydantoinase/oxoprolinase family protein [Aestuariicoccus sp. MJ-SS9]
MVRIAIDIGGTFTDMVAETADRLASVKVLTSSHSPETAALDGVGRLLDAMKIPLSQVSSVVHGTTLATNALIERRGAKTAFVTTAGFRDVLEMRYEKRFDQYALDLEMPEPLVPRPLRLGLSERILADGSVLQAPQDDEIDALAVQLQDAGAEAVAIGFLHAYRNPSHERHVAERLRARLDEAVTICLSSEVAGEIREYERFSTVCANAYVRPLMTRYVGRLLDGLRAKGFDGAFLMMLSDGALTTVDQATRFPIRLVEGGPAGGVALAAHVAREVGSERTLSIDIGGTTAKICFIENGIPKTSRRFEVARAWRDTKGSGLPVKVPTVELVEIGAGGGSIAQIDTLGRLKVGPRSAGSDPGPAAYGRGGDAPTVTDAHLAVGNLAARNFAGGIIQLAPERAGEVIARDIQTPLGLDDPAPAAAGIIELADETMANAARVHGVELGLDVARFDILVSGGGGGLHGARIAEKLGIRRIIVPDNAGVGSAVGFLRSPVAFEKALSVVEILGDIDRAALAARIASAVDEVTQVVAEAVPEHKIAQTVRAELRYKGQGLDVPLTLDAESAMDEALAGLEDRFEARYRDLVGFTLPDIPVELVSISVTAREDRDQTTATPAAPSPESPDTGTRPIYDLNARARLDYHEIRRDALGCGATQGPAVVPEAQTTTLVRPGWTLRRLPQGHLLMEREDA